ncbi:MAG TPA: hypothetical protein VIM72_22625, partial [Chitinophaga sp.]
KMAALEAKGVKVMPVGTGSNYLTVDAINAAGFSDRDMGLLTALKEQLIWVDLSGTAITDSAFVALGQLKKLTRLDLRNTAIKGNGIKELGNCRELRYLNLAGTAVNSEGLLALQQNKKLQQLYVYQAGLTPTAFRQLQQALPKLMLDTGGYRLQQLASDTIIYHKVSG